MSLNRPVELPLLRFQVADAVPAHALLGHPDHVWLGGPDADAGDTWLHHLQQRAGEGEEHEALIDALPRLSALRTDQLFVDLPALAGVRPALRLALSVAVGEAPGLGFAACPALGMSAVRANAADALAALAERARLDLLTREGAADLPALRALIAAGPVEILPFAGAVELPTAAEVRNNKKRASLLDKHLKSVHPAPAVFGMEGVADTLQRALQAGTGVILVGPGGVGKTELVRAAAASTSMVTADAAGLLLALMDGGRLWEAGLPELIEDLTTSRRWLHVSRLADLFEVGRYHTNPTSLAEALLPAVRAGKVRLVAEVSADELARLDARYPGALAGLARVTVPVPSGRMEAILQAWARRDAARLRVTITPDAVTELLRLLRRFHPYAGLPGRGVRFLESLAADRARLGEVVAGRADVLARFSEETGLPRNLLDPTVALPWSAIHAHLGARVFDQPDAVRAMTDAIAMVKADVARWGRPLVSCLLVGPTGVGKTETAKATAELLFGSADRMIRLDMSEFSTPAAVLRLIGGGDGEGVLTGAVRRQPFSVVLLDEVEKADRSLLDLLLQVLGEGRLVDDRGRLADFSGTVVLMTSNVGAVEARRPQQGFGRTDDRSDAWMTAVSAWLRPELRNRIDRVVVFGPLGADGVSRVLDRELGSLRARHALAAHELVVTPEARAALERLGLDPAWGARHLQRTLQERMVEPIARRINQLGGSVRARIEVSATPAGGLEVSVATLPARPDTSHRDWDRLTALDLHLRQVAAGDARTMLDAERDRRRRELRRGHISPEARDRLHHMELAITALDELGARVATAARQTGAQTLLGRPPADGHLLYEALHAAARDVLRRYVTVVNPASAWAMVGVYAPSVALRDAVLLVIDAIVAQLGCGCQRAVVYPDGKGGFATAAAGASPPKDAEAPIGVELELDGPAVLPVLAMLEGVVEVVMPGDPAAQTALVTVGTAPGRDAAQRRAGWEKRRPKDLQRHTAYKGERCDELMRMVVDSHIRRRPVDVVVEVFLQASLDVLLESAT